MNEPLDLDDPYVKWCNDIWCAQRGDLSRLIAALRSDRPLCVRAERMLRDCTAALLAGEYKRRRGEHKRRRKSVVDLEVDLAEDRVRTIKMRARAAGHTHGIERAAVEYVVREYAEDLKDLSVEDVECLERKYPSRFITPDSLRNRLHNRIHRAPKKLRKK